MNSIRARIIIGHLVIIATIAVLVVLSFSYLDNVSKIQEFDRAISATHQSVLQMIRLSSKVRFEESKSHLFYTLDSNQVLSEHDSHAMDAVQNLQKVQRNMPYEFVELSLLVGESLGLLGEYQMVFQRVIELQKKRGFRNDGLEGLMRTYAHELETYTDEIDLVDILSLRRHEKDYFLRGDTVYVQNFNELAGRVKGNVVASFGPNARSLPVIDKYQKNFNDVVALEAEIGTDSFGLVRLINTLKDEIELRIRRMNEITSVKAESLIDSLRFNMLVGLLVSILFSVVLSVVVASVIARPIKALAASMENAHKEGFGGELVSIDADATVKEVRVLETAYRDLINRVSLQLKELGEQNIKLKELNERLTASEHELMESNALKDKFFSIISHDLRGPMINLFSFLELLLEPSHGLNKQEINELTKSLKESVGSLNILLENLLEWARSEMGLVEVKQEKVDMKAILKSNKKLFKDQLSTKNISFVVDCPENLVLTSDRHIVDFVLRNLISNAIKFSHAGGSVFISAEQVGDDIVVSVADQGVGISPQKIGRLFNSRYHISTKGTTNEIGTGLGLVLCGEFVAKLNGHISVISKKGEGTTFHITFPKVFQNTGAQDYARSL